MSSKFSSWWYHDGRYIHRNFVKGVKNLWRWFPVIWKDRDLDQYYIYEILAKKIQFQAKSISDNDRHTEAKRDAERMQLVVKLIRLQQDGFYESEYMNYEETKVWFEDVQGHPGYSELKSETVSDRHDEYFAKYPRQYKKALAGELNMFKRDKIETENKHVMAMEIAHENQRRCKTLLFKLMESNIERWWD